MYDYGELNWFQFKQLNENRNLPLQQQVNRFNSYINELSNNLHSISSIANSTGAAAGGYQDTPITSSVTYYNVAGCERMEYHVIAYTGFGVLAEGTIVNNDTPECWTILDIATGSEDVGTIAYVWDTPDDCQPCIASHAFSGTIYWGEDSSTACGQTIPIVVTGSAATFCGSSDFYSEDFRTIGTGGIYISYGGQLKTVNISSGDNFVTYNGGCDSC